MIFTLSSFAYSATMIYVFYYIPRQSGMVVANLSYTNDDLTLDVTNGSLSMLRNEQSAKELFTVLLSQDNFENKQRNSELISGDSDTKTRKLSSAWLSDGMHRQSSEYFKQMAISDTVVESEKKT